MGIVKEIKFKYRFVLRICFKDYDQYFILHILYISVYYIHSKFHQKVQKNSQSNYCNMLVFMYLM